MKTTGDQQLVKHINRSVLLRLVRSRPGLSRAQLALRSGLTKSTVSLLVRELIAEGWLCEDAIASNSGLGRPSTPVQLDGRRRGLIGMELAVDCLRVVSVSLTGEVLCSLEEPLESKRPERVCAQASHLARVAYGELDAGGVLLTGIGAGLPGAFDQATGVVRFAPNLGWRNVDFVPMLTQALQAEGLPSVPLHVQNEADTGALSEYEFAQEEIRETLIFVTCDVGVGAGIVLNDRLFTGSHGMAGEIGHTILQVFGELCSCGRRGCAETFVGSAALHRELEFSGNVSRAGRYLGLLVQNLWTTFDPGVIVLGGGSCVRRPELATFARETLHNYAAAAGMEPPVIRLARYGLLASAVGAAALVLHQHVRPLYPLHPLAQREMSLGMDVGTPMPPLTEI